MTMKHFNCRCVFLPTHEHVQLTMDVEKVLNDICIITPRTLHDLRHSFVGYFATQQHGILDLANICYRQAVNNAPLPWESDYEESLLNDMLSQMEFA